MIEACQCTEVGHCSLMGRKVNANQLRMCQTNQHGYRDYWLNGIDNSPPPTTIDTLKQEDVPDDPEGKPAILRTDPTDIPCRYRSEKPIDTALCGVCGLRHVGVDVYKCELLGECTIGNYRSRQHACIKCKKREVMEGEALTPPKITPRMAARQRRIEERAANRQRRAVERAARAAEIGETTLAPTHSVVQGPPAAASSDTPFSDVEGRPLRFDAIYKGSSLFLILSGPSIRKLDLSKLDRRGIMTMGVNNSPTIRRTDFMIFVDRPSKFHESIWLDPRTIKLVASNAGHRSLAYKPLRRKLPDGQFVVMTRLTADGRTEPARPIDMPGVVLHVRNSQFNPEVWLSEPTINWGLDKKWAAKTKVFPRTLNVMFAALKSAYALGFRKVYLLGCDFHMSFAQPYAFRQAKGIGGVGGNNNAYRNMDNMFKSLKPHFDRAGYRVYNCNPQSGLTAFPYLDYDAAIQAASGHVPQDPLDTDGWYYE